MSMKKCFFCELAGSSEWDQEEDNSSIEQLAVCD